MNLNIHKLCIMVQYKYLNHICNILKLNVTIIKLTLDPSKISLFWRPIKNRFITKFTNLFNHNFNKK